MLTEKLRRRGFTLVEILTSVSVTALIMVFLLPPLHYFPLMTVRATNLILAKDRGLLVLSVLEPRVLHAAFGITWNPCDDVFQRSFGGNRTTSPPPGRWLLGPVQVWRTDPIPAPASENGGVYRGNGLVVLYAVPSALRAVGVQFEPLTLFEGERATLCLVPFKSAESDVNERLRSGAKNDLWSWVTFPCTKLPVYVESRFKEKLTVRLAEYSGLTAVLRPWDEMHYLRSERFRVQNGILYSENLRNQWTDFQPRVDGILEMWFEWTPEKRLLEAWILASGGLSASVPASRPADWPAAAPWKKAFEFHDLAVVRASWIVGNLW